MKIKHAALVFLLLATTLSQSQVKFRVKKLNADSLVALIPEKDGTELVEVLNLLSNAICRKNIDSSILLATQAIELSEKLEYQKGLADGYFNTGNVYFLLDSLEATISNYLRALRFYEDHEPSQEFGNLCMQLYIINYFSGRDEAAKHYAKQAKNTYENINDKPGQAMATWVSNTGGWENGIEHCKKALTFLDTARNQNEAAFIYNSIGETYLDGYLQTGDTSHLNTALAWCFKALKLEEMDDDVKTVVYFTIGDILYQYNTDATIARAVDYFHKANRQADSSFDAYYWKPLINMYLGRVYFDQGNYNESIQYFKQGINIIEESFSDFSINAFREPVLGLNFKRHNKVYHQGMLKGLHDAYTAIGEYKLALEYFTLSSEAEEETYQERFQDMITMMEADSKAEKTEKQMALLESDNKVQELIIRQSRILIISAIGILIIVILTGIIFLRQNKMKNEHQKVLLEQKLLRSQMNPHFIFNSLANIQEFIWNKDPLTANEYLSSFSKLVRLILENSRNDFVPVEKEVSTINNYLTLQKLRHMDKFEYTVEVDPNIDVENMSIPPMLVQPFIENSIEHGIGAKETPGHIEVRFYRKDDFIHIEIQDDGIGFQKSSELKKDNKTDHQSLAMTITQERLLMHYKKYKQKIQLTISDLTNENNQVTGALVLFGIPYHQV